MYHKYYGKHIEGHDPRYGLWRNVYNKHPVIVFYAGCMVATTGLLIWKYFTKFQKPVDEICQYKLTYQVARHEDMKEPSAHYYAYKNDYTLKKEQEL